MANKKQKTKKAVAKRFKLTGTGKVKRSSSKRRHLLGDKPANKMRQKKKDSILNKTESKTVKEMLHNY